MSHRPAVGIVWLIVAGTAAPFAFNVIAALLPAVQAQFGLGEAQLQWMVSIYAFTLGAAQLVVGPLADAWGRRRILLGGLVVFALAGLGAALASSYAQLLACRVLQGIGGCAALVVPRTAVRDTHQGLEAARAMALIMISLAVTPAVSPLVGGLLLAAWNWRAGFFACALLGAGLFVAALRLHGETLPPERRVPLRAGTVLAGYVQVSGSMRFWAYSLSFSFSNSCFIGFLVVGPSYLTRTFGLTPIGVALAMLAGYLGFGLGNMLTARTVRRFGVERILWTGIAIGCAGTLILLVAAPLRSLAPLLTAIAVQSVGIGLAFPAGIAGATGVFPERAGTASALVGATQLVTGALFALIAGALADGSLMPLAWSCAGVSLLALAWALPVWPTRRAP